MSLTQLLLCRASLTDLPLLLTKETRAGAKSWIERPSGSQLSVQNLAVPPFPNSTAVVVLNKPRTSFSVLYSGISIHGMSPEFHRRNGHLQRSASPSHLKFITPKPPKDFGIQTRAHGSR